MDIVSVEHYVHFSYTSTMTITPLTPELRAQILSSIKDEGTSIADVAQTYGFAEDTIRKWIRQSADNAHTSSGELQRLRKENQLLKEIIGSLIFERESAKKNLTRA